MRAALDYKLLEENSIKGAKAALINVTGGPDMVLGEVEDAIGMIETEADDNADIIWGSVIREDMGDEIRITVIATGFDTAAAAAASAKGDRNPSSSGPDPPADQGLGHSAAGRPSAGRQYRRADFHASAGRLNNE